MRRSSFRTSLLACLIVIFATSLVGGAEGITVINKDQLKEELAKPDVTVVDVRATHDWETSDWKIQGAQRQIPAEAQEWMAKYAKDQNIVLYCA
jgi:rhodanese-related sulfurtransferase